MKRLLLIFAVFVIFAAGCSSAADRPTPQRQGYMADGNGQAGQALQMGNTLGINNSGWPGKDAGMGAGTGGGTGAVLIDATAPGAGTAALTGAQGSTAGTPRSNPSTGGVAILMGAASAADPGITLLGIKSPVRRGENGSLSIHGIPGTNYSVTAVYSNSLGTITATAVKRAAADGTANWTWNVKRDTLPGTYSVVIAGGGKMTAAAYTVIQ